MNSQWAHRFIFDMNPEPKVKKDHDQVSYQLPFEIMPFFVFEKIDLRHEFLTCLISISTIDVMCDSIFVFEFRPGENSP